MPLPENNMFFGFAEKLTEEQKEYVNSIFDNRLTMVNAISGSGKTTLAVACAKLLQKDLIYVFSPVEEKTMGFRKGSQTEKESAYIIPLHDALLEINENPIQVIYNEDIMATELFKKKGKNSIMQDVWVYPRSHVFARGTNMKNKTVIIDEAQNFTKGELKKVLTRIHDDCTVVMIGHTGQCDLPDASKSGFQAFINHFKGKSYAKYCELTKNFRGELATDADMLEW